MKKFRMFTIILILPYIFFIFEGHKGGVCTFLEHRLGRRLLHLACRHHVYELLLRKVVEVCWPATNGPDMAIFKHFRDRQWDHIDKKNYEHGLQDDLVAQIVGERRNEIVEFISNRIKVSSIL